VMRLMKSSVMRVIVVRLTVSGLSSDSSHDIAGMSVERRFHMGWKVFELLSRFDQLVQICLL